MFVLYRKIKELTEGSKIISELTFRKVKFADEGDYYCKAKNQYGEASNLFNLKIRCKFQRQFK